MALAAANPLRAAVRSWFNTQSTGIPSKAASLQLFRWITTEEPHLHCSLEPLMLENENIFQLTLSRPEVKNAIGRQMLKELQEAIYNLKREGSTRCLVVRSSVPGAFCAGADLKVFPACLIVLILGSFL